MKMFDTVWTSKPWKPGASAAFEMMPKGLLNGNHSKRKIGQRHKAGGATSTAIPKVIVIQIDWKARMTGVVAQRRSPLFLIVDQSLNVILKSWDLDLTELHVEMFSGLAARLQHSLARDEVLIETIGENTVLRIIPVQSAAGHWLAVFIDRFEREEPVLAAAKKYRLTKRETEVLELLIAGMTAAAAAHALHIAKSTTIDHIKGIMRKTQSDRRSDLIRRVLSRGDEPPENSPTISRSRSSYGG